MALRSLIQRYFYDPLETEQEEVEKESAELGVIAAFLRCEYTPELRKRLEVLRRANEPKPSQEGTMLYQCGVRDGIDLVIRHIDSLSDRIRESRDE